MIDERVVGVAKFWKTLHSMHVISGLTEAEFEQFSLLVLGFACVAESHSQWPIEVAESAREVSAALLDSGRNSNELNIEHAWTIACNALGRALQTIPPKDARRYSDRL